MPDWLFNAYNRRGGETMDVLRSFLRGESRKTRAAPVPGGYRMRSEPSTDEPGAFDLFSYRTRIARRHEGGDISVSPARYSTTTSKWQNTLAGMMAELGFEPTGETRPVHAINPAGWVNKPQELPFVHHHRDEAALLRKFNERTEAERAAREEREAEKRRLNFHPTGLGQTERESVHGKAERSGLLDWLMGRTRRQESKRSLLLTTPLVATQPEKESPRNRIAEGAADIEHVQAIEEEPNLERKKAMRKDIAKPFLFRDHRYLPSIALGPAGRGGSAISRTPAAKEGQPDIGMGTHPGGAFKKEPGHKGIVDMAMQHEADRRN